jgi:hypothetical protein
MVVNDMAYQKQGNKLVFVEEISVKSIKSRLTRVAHKCNEARERVDYWTKELSCLEQQLKELQELSKGVI